MYISFLQMMWLSTWRNQENQWTLLLLITVVVPLCPALCDPLDFSTPGFHVLHYLLEFGQTHVLWFGGAILPSHSLLPPSPAAVGLSHKVAKYRIKSKLRSFLYISSILWGNNNGKELSSYQARNLLKDRSKCNRKYIICVPLSLLRNIKGFE